MGNFTWVNFFQEVHRKIHEDNYNAQKLANIAKNIFGYIKDVDSNGDEIQLDEMTPINFIAYFNRNIAINNKIQYCKKLKNIMQLKTPTPTDFDGIPKFNNQNCLCMNFKKDRADYIIKEQWEFSKQLLNNNINKQLFNKILSTAHPQIAMSYLSRFCFIVKPDKYYSFDGQITKIFKTKTPKTYNDYMEYCKLLKSTYPNKTSYELSDDAFRKNQIKPQNKQDKFEDWIPQNYEPGITKEKWLELINNRKIFDLNSLNLIKCLYSIGGVASCKQLENKFGKTAQHYNSISVSLAKRIQKETKCNQYNGEIDNAKWWTILYLGKKAEKDTDGTFVWKLRPELQSALDEYFSTIKVNTMKTNIPLNQILYGPPGTGKTYNTIIKAMEIIGSKKVNMLNDDSDFRDNYNDEEYKILKEEFDNYKKMGQIEFVTFHQSYSYEEFIEGIKPNVENEELTYEKVDGIFKNICTAAKGEKGNNFNEVYENFINDLAENQPLILKTKRGKEFGVKLNSRKNLTLLMGENLQAWGTLTKDNLKNLSDWKYYANPIQNYLKEKYNLSFTTTFETKPHVLIIDEINRGNISKIFGELITLIEEDKREVLSVKLPYSKDSFTVPKNLHIIGTMNTSDRSIAAIDIALRRRFKFIEMMPKKELVADFEINFADIFEDLNTKIKILLDRDHQIGHSYFIKTKYKDAKIKELKTIWFSEILPLLNEYFYCDWEKLKLIVPNFIKKVDIPKALECECNEDIFEFITFDEIKDFKEAINLKGQL